ncbi:MAG: hypothetical protein U0234_20125 [Sandaracinus sp.]
MRSGADEASADVLELTASREALASYAARRARAAIGAWAIVLPIVVGILVVEYRLMLFAIIALAGAIVPTAQAVRARRVAGPSGLVVRLESSGLRVRAAGPEVRAPLSDVRASVEDGTLLLSVRDGERWHMLAVPGEASVVEAFAVALERQGMTVPRARAGGLVLVLLLVGVVAQRGLAIVGSVLVLAGLASLGLTLAGRPSGSVLTGLGLVGGGFACLVGAALVLALARRR